MDAAASQENKLNIFVTGADRGVARVTVRALRKQGYNVIGSTRRGAKGAERIREDGALPVYPDMSRAGEIRSALQFCKADIIIHLEPQQLNGVPLVNLDWRSGAASLAAETDALVTAAGQAGIKRLIFAGAGFAYGSQDAHLIDEATPLARENALQRALADAEAAVLDGGIAAYALRAGFVYGSQAWATRALHDALRMGKGVLSGAGVSSWLHEEDLAQALVKLVALELSDEEARATVYNIGGEEQAAPDQFADAFGAAVGIGTPSRVNPLLRLLRDDAVQNALLNDAKPLKTAKVREELSWLPQFGALRAGIERTLLLWRAEGADQTPAPASTKEIVQA